MNIDTAQLTAVKAQVADQAEAITSLVEHWNDLTDCLRAMYRAAGEPLPRALRPQARDRHGLHVVRRDAS
jgi:hypothetical protein